MRKTKREQLRRKRISETKRIKKILGFKFEDGHVLTADQLNTLVLKVVDYVTEKL